jgi:hypothetical protein
VAVESYLGVEYDGADAFEESYKSESLLRLADLIDPTCEVESVDSTGGLLAYRLSCGHTAYRPAYIQGPPPVCPNCGSRVTSGGETGND